MRLVGGRRQPARPPARAPAAARWMSLAPADTNASRSIPWARACTVGVGPAGVGQPVQFVDSRTRNAHPIAGPRDQRHPGDAQRRRQRHRLAGHPLQVQQRPGSAAPAPAWARRCAPSAPRTATSRARGRARRRPPGAAGRPHLPEAPQRPQPQRQQHAATAQRRRSRAESPGGAPAAAASRAARRWPDATAKRGAAAAARIPPAKAVAHSESSTTGCREPRVALRAFERVG